MKGSVDNIKTVFNDNADIYADKYMSVAKYQNELQQLCKLIVEDEARILDIACGPGNLSQYMISRNPKYRILGIDFALAMISKARSLVANVEFQLMDVREIGQLNQKFDVIICGFVMPYLEDEDIEKMMLDIKKLLCQNGLLYISTILGEKDEQIAKKSSDGKNDLMIRLFTEQTLSDTVFKHNLTMEYLSVLKSAQSDENANDEIIVIARNQ